MSCRYSGCQRLLWTALDGHRVLDVPRAGVAVRSEAKATTPVSKNSWCSLFSGMRWQDLPERLIFLNGAPGSGKTKALDTVRASSGIQNAISMSSVISQHREMAPDALKSMSGLCGDEMACSALATSMRASPLGTRALIVDGFPRSDAQVDFLEEFIHHVRYARSLQPGITRPQLEMCMVVLHVDEDTSIQRQMARQAAAEEHNAEVRRSGEGTLMEERITDQSPQLCRDRFAVFARSMPALARVESLMKVYHIDASSPMETCSYEIASALIEHRSEQSQSSNGTSGAPAQQKESLQAPIESSGVSQWWAACSKWLGFSTEEFQTPRVVLRHGGGWTPQGVVWC